MTAYDMIVHVHIDSQLYEVLLKMSALFMLLNFEWGHFPAMLSRILYGCSIICSYLNSQLNFIKYYQTDMGGQTKLGYDCLICVVTSCKFLFGFGKVILLVENYCLCQCKSHFNLRNFFVTKILFVTIK